MPTQDLQRVREVFEAASVEEGAAREEYLYRECAGDDELRAVVERMIAADSEPNVLLDRPLAPASMFSEDGVLQAGYRIGPYRIIRGIASGGMGVVYLAAVAGESEARVVALKILQGFSLDFSRRFQHEGEILTRLQHPNIARLLDAGTTPENHPYFVMEYIEGSALDLYCARKALNTRERITLFRQVCAAVNYLHQNLVIHRDLKPANILVTEEGFVKLLDFGIAKLLNDSRAADTVTGLMTPGYASPEQVRGLPTSTLTDVYGLGILLYEVLTGVRPFVTDAGELHEVLRRVCEQDPLAPSSVVAGLKGELDNIVLKAIRKEPGRRYASVEQFDEDLRRYLNGLPVLAQGDSLSYRLRKFCGRHWAGIAASAAMITVLAGGIAATAWEAKIARQERILAERHAQTAESARAIADQQRIRADARSADAEREKANAERERANAERRLAELQQVARAAVGIYAAGDMPGRSSAALIAETARDSLAILQSEGIHDAGMSELSDRALNDARSYALARDPAWHIPAGWQAQETVKGEFQVGVDHTIVHQGKSSLFVRAQVSNPAGEAVITQTFDAAAYKNRRVRLSGYFRTARIGGAAYFFIGAGEASDRVSIGDGPQWKRYQLVIDIPPDAEVLEMGIQLMASGTLWADDLAFEQVPGTVPLTARRQPENLNFTNSH
jgi:predicted Ser/Thr protein kinase